MKAIVVVAAALLVGVLRPDPAHAWASANRWGGSTSHSWGSTSHTNAWGGSSSHTYGEGSEHTNMYGGSSAHAWGGGSEHTNVYGGSTYGAYGQGATHTYASGATAYHPPGYGGYGYSAYHPPVAVPYIRRRDVLAAPRQRVRLSAQPWGRWQPPPTRRQHTLPGTPLAAGRDIRRV